MTGYFIESLIMSVAIQFNFQVFSTNAYKFTTFPARSFRTRESQRGQSSLLTEGAKAELTANNQSSTSITAPIYISGAWISPNRQFTTSRIRRAG